MTMLKTLVVLAIVAGVLATETEFVIRKKDISHNQCRAFVRKYDDVTNESIECFEYDLKLYSQPETKPDGDCVRDVFMGPGDLPPQFMIPMVNCSTNGRLQSYANIVFAEIVANSTKTN